MLKPSFLLVGLLFGALVPSRATAQQSSLGGLAIAPLIQRVQTSAGRTVSVTFGITNPSPQASEGTAVLRSVSFENGSYRAVDATHDRDLTQFAVQREATARLAPGKDGEIHFQFKIPSSASGVYWSLLTFRPKVVGSNAGIALSYEIPIIVFVGRQARPEVSVKSPTLVGKGEGLLVKVDLENAGDGYTPIGVSGELRNVNGGLVKPFAMPDRNLFPHSSRTMTFPMLRVPDGRYRIVAQVEMGTRRLPRITSEVTVVRGEAQVATENARFETTPVVASPGAFSVALPPGGSKTQALRLTNISREPITLTLKAAMVAQGSDGLLGIGAAALPEGLEVEVSPSEVTLEPNRSVGVRIVARAAAGSSGDKWLCVTMSDAAHAGSLPEFVPGNFVVEGELKPKIDMALGGIERAGGRPAGIAFTVCNSGNLAVRPIRSGQILLDGVRPAGLIQIPELGMGGILPGATLKNAVTLPPSLPPGKYVAILRYGLSETDPNGLRVPFEIPAPTVPKAGKPAPGKRPTTAKHGKS